MLFSASSCVRNSANFLPSPPSARTNSVSPSETTTSLPLESVPCTRTWSPVESSTLSPLSPSSSSPSPSSSSPSADFLSSIKLFPPSTLDFLTSRSSLRTSSVVLVSEILSPVATVFVPSICFCEAIADAVDWVFVPCIVFCAEIAAPFELDALASWLTLRLNDPLLNAPVAERPNSPLFVVKLAGVPLISVFFALDLSSTASRAAVLSFPSSDLNVEKRELLA